MIKTVLSIKQPWLHCITDLDKCVENRTWAPPSHIIGKNIALHSSKSFKMVEYVSASQRAGFDLTDLYRRGDIVHGCIVATANVVGYVMRDGNQWRKFGRMVDQYDPYTDKWLFGPYGWILTDIYKLSRPIPATGRLGLWKYEWSSDNG